MSSEAQTRRSIVGKLFLNEPRPSGYDDLHTVILAASGGAVDSRGEQRLDAFTSGTKDGSPS